eukprot:2137004-Pyramimonas_sp.AAC.1
MRMTNRLNHLRMFVVILLFVEPLVCPGSERNRRRLRVRPRDPGESSRRALRTLGSRFATGAAAKSETTIVWSGAAAESKGRLGGAGVKGATRVKAGGRFSKGTVYKGSSAPWALRRFVSAIMFGRM